MFNVSALMFM